MINRADKAALLPVQKIHSLAGIYTGVNIDKDNSNYNNTRNKKLTAVKKAILQCQRMRNYLKSTRHRYHVHPKLDQRRPASRVHRELQQYCP